MVFVPVPNCNHPDRVDEVPAPLAKPNQCTPPREHDTFRYFPTDDRLFLEEVEDHSHCHTPDRYTYYLKKEGIM